MTTAAFIRVQVVSYDLSTDSFTITTPVIEHNEEGWSEGMLNCDFDADDSVIDAGLFCNLVGVFDEPDYFVGREFDLTARVPVR